MVYPVLGDHQVTRGELDIRQKSKALRTGQTWRASRGTRTIPSSLIATELESISLLTVLPESRTSFRRVRMKSFGHMLMQCRHSDMEYCQGESCDLSEEALSQLIALQWIRATIPRMGLLSQVEVRRLQE